MNLRITPASRSRRGREQGGKPIRPNPRPVLPRQVPGKQSR
ncbi:hypothetical protein [Amycolatopsis taiwanensis]|nr:hypothetical protein [Amycolatopsis taiwanensis]